jgi:TruB family pseudouridylate synthase (N terminal domain)
MRRLGAMLSLTACSMLLFMWQSLLDKHILDNAQTTWAESLACAQVGHAGTLDPQATGLLIICIGKGCKKVGSASCQYDVILPCHHAFPQHLLTHLCPSRRAQRKAVSRLCRRSTCS